MFAKILTWLLRLVDIDVDLNGDILTIKIMLGKITVLDLKLDLIKDNTTTGSVRSAAVHRRKK